MTLVDVTCINQLMHHGPKSVIPSHLTIIRRLWSLRRITSNFCSRITLGTVWGSGGGGTFEGTD